MYLSIISVLHTVDSGLHRRNRQEHQHRSKAMICCGPGQQENIIIICVHHILDIFITITCSYSPSEGIPTQFLFTLSYFHLTFHWERLLKKNVYVNTQATSMHLSCRCSKSWMYKENWIQRRRRGPVHSYESCSVVHEAKMAWLNGRKIPRSPGFLHTHLCFDKSRLRSAISRG